MPWQAFFSLLPYFLSSDAPQRKSRPPYSARSPPPSGARPDKNDCSLPSQQQARRPCPALQMKFPIPPAALSDDSDKTQQRPPMPPDLDRFPASVYTVFRFMSSGNRTAVAPPTPPGPKGSNGNGCCRVSGSQKGATRLRPFSLTPPWLRHAIRLSAGAFFASLCPRAASPRNSRPRSTQKRRRQLSPLPPPIVPVRFVQNRIRPDVPFRRSDVRPSRERTRSRRNRPPERLRA